MATENRKDRRRIEDWGGATTSNVIPDGQYRWYDGVAGYNAAEVIELIGDGSITIASLPKRQPNTDGAQTLYGVKTFNAIPVLPSTAPSSDNQAMSKVHAEALLGLPTKYITGLTIDNNSVDADNDMDIATGSCRDYADSVDITVLTTIVKRLDAAWAVGTGNGGIDTGSMAASTTYYMYVIRKDSDATIDGLFSLSDTSPTLPSGWSKYRILGVFYTDSATDIETYTQPDGYERKYYDYTNTGNVNNTWGDGTYMFLIRRSDNAVTVSISARLNTVDGVGNLETTQGAGPDQARIRMSGASFITVMSLNTYYIAEIHFLTGKLRLDE